MSIYTGFHNGGTANKPADRSTPKRKKKPTKTRQLIRAIRRAHFYKLIVDVMFERIPKDKQKLIIAEARRRQYVELSEQAKRKREALLRAEAKKKAH